MDFMAYILVSQLAIVLLGRKSLMTLVAFFNVLACIGWSSVNLIVGGQLINTVNHHVPGWAGILIIAFCTLFVTMFGYKVVHAYEFWSWIPTFIVFLIVLGRGAFFAITK